MARKAQKEIQTGPGVGRGFLYQRGPVTSRSVKAQINRIAPKPATVKPTTPLKSVTTVKGAKGYGRFVKAKATRTTAQQAADAASAERMTAQVRKAKRYSTVKKAGVAGTAAAGVGGFIVGQETQKKADNAKKATKGQRAAGKRYSAQGRAKKP